MYKFCLEHVVGSAVGIWTQKCIAKAEISRYGHVTWTSTVIFSGMMAPNDIILLYLGNINSVLPKI